MSANSASAEGPAERLHGRLREALKRLDALRIDFTGPYATSKGYVIEIEKRLLTIPELLSLFDGQRPEAAILREAVLKKVRKMPRE